jgi:hypothetical protein
MPACWRWHVPSGCSVGLQLRSAVACFEGVRSAKTSWSEAERGREGDEWPAHPSTVCSHPNNNLYQQHQHFRRSSLASDSTAPHDCISLCHPKPRQIWYDSSSHRPRQAYYPAARQQNKPPVEEIGNHQIQFGTENADYERAHRPTH